MQLKDLAIKISYRSIGEENILDNFIVPALKVSKVYKRSVGFFSSSVFELLKAGLQTFEENGGDIRIICSPKLEKKDVEAIKLGYKLRDEVISDIFIEDLYSALEDITDENLYILVKLIKDNHLNIRLVEIDKNYGMYHDKIGIFEDNEGNKVLFVGSPNESKNAYQFNYEKIRIAKSWVESDRERILDDEEEFDSIWNGENKYIKRKDFTDVVVKEIQKELRKRGRTEVEKKPIILRDYQSAAINAWEQNGRTGFFVMATGTGKTWTAIYAALNIIKDESILLVICAPYKHLVRQWYEDIHKVLNQYVTVLVSGENSNWPDELKEAIMNSKYNEKRTIIVISTIKSFNSEKFAQITDKTDMERMLIVDEAHRFKNLSQKIKNDYKYMLGLSATPSSRKNDEFGQKLVTYFGGQVYDLPIEFAIEKGYLVHYNYYPIIVNATREEEELFDYYTRLMSSCFRNKICIDIEKLTKYKRARLRVISMAEEKRQSLNWIFDQIKERDHFIVYCGDGRLHDEENEEIRHIQYIKNRLTDRGIRVSQFTAKENMDERMQRVEAFNTGMIDSMVAIRCLDEGINIPSIEGALLLSSNDDYREFVQRRGRILRKYNNPYSSKEKGNANIYDVIVLPSDNAKAFASIELRRYYEYAKLANNSEECLDELNSLLLRYGIELEELIDIEDLEDELDE